MPTHRSGRHFLHIPGPTNIPDRVLAAVSRPTIDHRSEEFGELGLEVLSNLQRVFKTNQPVFMFPASGTGAWEAGLTNVLNTGDSILIYETGYFAAQWKRLATKLGFDVKVIESDWRSSVDPSRIYDYLKNDINQSIKGVCVVHNETSTGVTSDIMAVRNAIDDAKHQALLFVDTISSLASIDYQHDAWRVDVAIGGSQKGLMLPPGLSFNAVSTRALTLHTTSQYNRGYWDWGDMLPHNEKGFFPYTPATNLIFGLQESLKIILDEVGLDNVFGRHARHAAATREAVTHWGLETMCRDPAAFSNTLTAVMTPTGISANQLRQKILDKFDMSLGAGLGKFNDQVFRIGHLGDLNDLSLAGTLSGVEMGLALCAIPFNTGGVSRALDYLMRSN
ncbi:MAG: aminotransferase class V-fold PLP-dependent enzyme [Proteobacteria bacterium]|nr:aminotransferase class V-fold PLP-dependent enzyme [Pseudomonadota bacterium]